jgi:hypothetical protein
MGEAPPPPASRRKPATHSDPLLRRVARRWRLWLRAVHRDVGYLAVGLTFVYALSGLAINHIGSWDPNFRVASETATLAQPLPRADKAAAAQLLAQFGVTDTPRDAFWDSDTAFEIDLDGGTIKADTARNTATYSHEEPRFFLRVANWLHYNRGKAAWTYVADAYAAFLLFLATSGLFMLKGRKGLLGRGGVLLLLGAAVPILYVQLSGGP